MGGEIRRGEDGLIDPEALWNRLPNEPIRAFKAFEKYRDMGVDRSLRKAAETYNTSSTGSPETRLRDLCRVAAKHRWKERVRAFDDWEAAEHLLTLARQKKQALDLRVATNMAGLSKAAARIAGLDSSKIPIPEAIKLSKECQEGLRIDLGDPSVRAEITGPHGAPMATGQVILYLPDNGMSHRSKVADDVDDDPKP